MARANDVCLLRTLRLGILRNGLVTTATDGEKVTFECHKFPETADNQTWKSTLWNMSETRSRAEETVSYRVK